jgi:protoporphyrinogen oxidase
MKKNLKTRLLIVGGGISGISAGAEAQKKNIPYLLLEKSPALGGLTRSIYADDYIFDYTGHFLHLAHYKDPAEIGPGFDLTQWKTISRNSKCYYQNQLIDAPFQYNVDQLPERIRAKLLFSYLNRNKISKSIHSFQEYLLGHFGKGIADAFLIPYNEKILATNLDRISKDAVTRFFPPPNEKLILRKRKRAEPENAGLYNSSFWYPTGNGIQLLVDSLSKQLRPDSVMLNTGLQRIDLKNKTVHTTSGITIRYEELISSIPLPILIKASELRSKYASYLKSDITAATVLSFHIGIKMDLPEKFKGLHWIYFSEKKYPFYRVGFYSNFNEAMCPPGSYSIYVEVGVSKQQGNDLGKIQSEVIRSLHKIGVIDKEKIDILIANFMKDGYVHYTHKRESLVRQLSDELKKNQIHLIGRYGKWQYSSMEDSILEGANAVRQKKTRS